MEIYNGNMERIENPDLSLGYLTPGKRTEHHAAVQGVAEQWHYETVAEYPNGGKDIRRVIDVPGVEARDAWDEEIAIQIYTPYTAEELAQMEADRNKPTTEQRLAALEEENRQLKEALDLLLSGAMEEADANG